MIPYLLLEWSGRLVLFLVVPPLRGPCVGSFPKIPTSKLPIAVFYRTWPVVHNTNGQDRNNDALERHGAPFPLTAKHTMEY